MRISLRTVEGLDVPDRLVEAARRIGEVVRDGAGDLDLVFVGERVDEGLCLIDELDREHRGSLVLCTSHGCRRDLGDEIRRRGALTYWKDPFPEWLAELTAEAVDRARDGRTTERGMADLRRNVNGPPEHVLTQLVETARQALGAHRGITAHLPRDRGDAFTMMTIDKGGRRADADWLRDGKAIGPPEHLAEHAIAWDRIVVVPCVEEAEIVGPIEGQRTYGAAIAIPIGRERDAVRPAVINLYFEDPFLPTAREFALLETLRDLGRATWARIADRERWHDRHVARATALAGTGWQAADTRAYIDNTLKAHATTAKLVEVWTRVLLSSRGADPWIGMPGMGRKGLSLSPELVATHAKRAVVHDGLPFPLDDGRFALHRQLKRDQDGRSLGDVLAVFSELPFALEAAGDLDVLASDMTLAGQLLRRARDSETIVRLAHAHAGSAGSLEALAALARVICDRLDADGVKVTVVASSGRRNELEQLFRTGQERRAPERSEVDEKRGLADWVVLNNDWLLARHPPGEAVSKPSACLTSGGRRFERRAKPAGDFWTLDGTAPVVDDEQVQLMVPMAHEGRVGGVLGVWRTSDAPFDTAIDVESMSHFAQYMAAASVQIMAQERQQDEVAQIEALARLLVPDCPWSDAARFMLEGLCELADVHAAALFQYDPQTRKLFFAGEGAHRGRCPSLERLCIVVPEAADTWYDALQAELRSTEISKCVGTPRIHIPFPQDPRKQPHGLVVLFDPPGRAIASTFASSAAVQAARSYLRYAAVLLEGHVRACGESLVDQLARRFDEDAVPVADFAALAAKLLQRAVGGDVTALAYRPSGSKLVAVDAFPPVPDLENAGLSGGSLTRWSVDHGRVVRVLDASDSTDLNQRRMNLKQLNRLASRTGNRTSVRSWMCAPIRHNQRCIGVVKLISSSDGPFFGPEHGQLMASVREWAETQARQILGHERLAELNEIQRELAGSMGAGLGEEIVGRLEPWCQRHIGRQCQVAVVARHGTVRLLLVAASSGVGEAARAAYGDLSRRLGTKSRAWDRGDELQAGDSGSFAPNRAGAAVPFVLPGSEVLMGHLIVLPAGRDRPTPAEIQIVREAAREVVLVLHTELVRQEWKFQAGIFRHALLGPVQGLQSAALNISDIAEDLEMEDRDLLESRQQVVEEAEVIRLWLTQRAFAMMEDGEHLDLRIRPSALRPIVERCVRRYRPILEARGIKVTLKWGSGGSLQIPLDQAAFDLALSNLLDNARKYAFYNREVTVGVELRGSPPDVHVWVEDTGTGIPDDLAEIIYDPGARAGHRDPIRAIRGEGIGLHMARTILRAHGGDVVHTSEPTSTRQDAKAPFIVRFTMIVPTQWRGR